MISYDEMVERFRRYGWRLTATDDGYIAEPRYSVNAKVYQTLLMLLGLALIWALLLSPRPLSDVQRLRLTPSALLSPLRYPPETITRYCNHLVGTLDDGRPYLAPLPSGSSLDLSDYEIVYVNRNGCAEYTQVVGVEYFWAVWQTFVQVLLGGVALFVGINAAWMVVQQRRVRPVRLRDEGDLPVMVYEGVTMYPTSADEIDTLADRFGGVTAQQLAWTAVVLVIGGLLVGQILLSFLVNIAITG